MPLLQNFADVDAKKGRGLGRTRRGKQKRAATNDDRHPKEAALAESQNFGPPIRLLRAK